MTILSLLPGDTRRAHNFPDVFGAVWSCHLETRRQTGWGGILPTSLQLQPLPARCSRSASFPDVHTFLVELPGSPRSFSLTHFLLAAWQPADPPARALDASASPGSTPRSCSVWRCLPLPVLPQAPWCSTAPSHTLLLQHRAVPPLAQSPSHPPTTLQGCAFLPSPP